MPSPTYLECHKHLAEQEKYKPIQEVAELVRRFFIPRSEKQPDKTQPFGYCPTFKYKNELDGVVIPNAAEVERRAAFNSPGQFWSDDKEKEFLSDFISYWFKVE